MSGAFRVVYDDIGKGYAHRRRPDARIARAIERALRSSRPLLNVGAGAGSYEPSPPGVVAIDLSATMLAQRPAGAAPAVRGNAMRLPFADGQFETALAVLTLHHWTDPRRGLEELARVSRRQVLFTFDPSHHHDEFWLVRDYLPDIFRIDADIHPPFDTLRDLLGPLDVQVVPVPEDCTDGFLCAYWKRPESYLDPEVRRSISTFAMLPDPTQALEALRRDLEDGSFWQRNAELLDHESMDYGYRVVIAGG